MVECELWDEHSYIGSTPNTLSARRNLSRAELPLAFELCELCLFRQDFISSLLHVVCLRTFIALEGKYTLLNVPTPIVLESGSC